MNKFLNWIYSRISKNELLTKRNFPEKATTPIAIMRFFGEVFHWFKTIQCEKFDENADFLMILLINSQKKLKISEIATISETY